jgi:hypothetical protein
MIPANERVIIDTVLNKFHSQGKFEWIIKSTLYAFPVFVAWRTLYKDRIPTRKSRAVVDIQKLNRVVVSDAYPIPLQSDIIRAMFGCKYISVIDGTDFFY